MTNPFKPISRVNLHSEVMQQITAAIQSGQWKPGSKLPGEIALAEMFQVSRTCIREVLKALAYSGVVESRSGVGTFVKEIPSEAPSPAVDLLSSWKNLSERTDIFPRCLPLIRSKATKKEPVSVSLTGT